MATWELIGWVVWRLTKAFFLLVFSGIVGAHVGMLAGFGLGALTWDWAWVHHGRCAGWTLAMVTAIIGIPTGHVRFGSGDRKRQAAEPRQGLVQEPLVAGATPIGEDANRGHPGL